MNQLLAARLLQQFLQAGRREAMIFGASEVRVFVVLLREFVFLLVFCATWGLLGLLVPLIPFLSGSSSVHHADR